MSGKRFILLLACSLLCTAAIAGSGRFPRGLHAGAGYSNHLESIKMKYEDAGKHFLSGNFHGAYASLGYEFHFEENMPLFLDVSLGFRRAWGSLHDMDVTEDYLFLPVRCGWEFRIARAFSLSPYAGASFQYGLSSEGEDYDFYNADGRLYSHRANLYLGAGVAVKVARHLIIDFGYDMGLVPRFSKTTPTEKARWYSSGLHAGLAYIF
ncbi:MAG: outer membrane beta-barrel protein [Bacteroidales bacterium]|nr:outer membrane beta-barrel protein [Bacteroidales bacterium]